MLDHRQRRWPNQLAYIAGYGFGLGGLGHDRCIFFNIKTKKSVFHPPTHEGCICKPTVVIDFNVDAFKYVMIADIRWHTARYKLTLQIRYKYRYFMPANIGISCWVIGLCRSEVITYAGNKLFTRLLC